MPIAAPLSLLIPGECRKRPRMLDFFARFRRRPAQPPAPTTTMAYDPRQWRRERITRDIPVRSQGNVEFYALEGDDLEYVATVAQAADNQWVSRQLLTKMLKSRTIQGLADVESERYPVYGRSISGRWLLRGRLSSIARICTTPMRCAKIIYNLGRTARRSRRS